jgi:hypothetical protein
VRNGVRRERVVSRRESIADQGNRPAVAAARASDLHRGKEEEKIARRQNLKGPFKLGMLSRRQKKINI